MTTPFKIMAVVFVLCIGILLILIGRWSVDSDEIEPDWMTFTKVTEYCDVEHYHTVKIPRSLLRETIINEIDSQCKTVEVDSLNQVWYVTSYFLAYEIIYLDLFCYVVKENPVLMIQKNKADEN